MADATSEEKHHNTLKTAADIETLYQQSLHNMALWFIDCRSILKIH
jgi:hypothetical protein